MQLSDTPDRCSISLTVSIGKAAMGFMLRSCKAHL